MLVESGHITEAQLHRALTAHLVFGGHLGTTLLELGYLDEDTLGETLAQMFGVPYADFDTLAKVPYSVVRSLPVKLVEKHRVVPLRLDGKRLHLAMIDPRNLLAIDEISFVTGYHIEPWVSPEIHILNALESYYNIRRTQRHVTLVRELSRLRDQTNENPKSQRLEGRGAGTSAEPEPAVARAAANDPGSASVARVPDSAYQDLQVCDQWSAVSYDRSWKDLAAALDRGSASRPDSDAEGGGDTTEPVPAEDPDRDAHKIESRSEELSPTLLEASRYLAHAESVDEVMSTTLGYMSARLQRCALFVVKGDRAVGWAGEGEGISEEMVKSLSIILPPRNRDSILSLVPENGTHYLGPVVRLPGVQDFYRRMAVRPPRSVLVVPIKVRNRVTAYLYGDNGSTEITAETDPLLTLCTRTGMALQIMILRNKILSLRDS